jgi:hypothetical protein
MAHRIAKLALLATALAATPAAAQTVGVNAAVVNDVRMTTDANRAVHKAVVRERVSLGNDILTGKASRLQVVLLDRTTFTVGANARIKVDRFVYDPNRKASAVGLTVTRGAFRFMSGRATHNSPGQSGIRTPTASIGIRGTVIDGAVGPDAARIARAEPGMPAFRADPETATLILLRGPGATAGEVPGGIDVTAGGTTVPIDQAGLAVFIPAPGQAPIGPFALSAAGSARLIALLTAPGFDPGSEQLPNDPGTPRDGIRQLPGEGGQPGPIRDPINPNNPNSPGVPGAPGPRI